MPTFHATRALRLRLFTSLAPVALVASQATLVVASAGLAGCGGTPPTPPAAPEAVVAKPIATSPPADTSAVPEPKSLLVFARVSKPQQVLDVIGNWTGLQGLGAEAVAELVSGEGVGAAVDLAQPIDVAITAEAGATGPRVSFAMSVAAKPNARAALSEQFELVDRNGVTRLRPKHGADDDDDDDRRCALFASAGATKSRLVCGGSDGALTAIGPYLSRTTPRQTYPADVHLDARLDSLRPTITQGRALLPTLAAGALGANRTGNPAAAELVNAAFGDAVDLALDIDKLTFDAQLADPAAAATLTVSFRDTTSWMAKVATSHPERVDAPPAPFWHLPIDSDAAFFRRGIDASQLSRPLGLVAKTITGTLDKSALGAADKKAFSDAVTNAFSVIGSPGVVARGFDAADVQKKLAALKQAKDTARADAEHAAADAVAGWTLIGLDEPIAKVGPVAKELASASSRPAITKWAAAESKDVAIVGTKSIPVAAKLQLPKDSIELEVTSHRAVDDASPEPPPRKGAKPAAAPKPTAPKLGRIEKTHVLIVPDAGHTWIAIGTDDALLASKVRSSLSTAPDAGTLAKRDGLDDLKNVKIGAGGFMSVRGVLAGGAKAWTAEHSGSIPGVLAAVTAASAGTPIPITFTPRAGDGGAGSVVTTVKVPRAAIQEIVAAATRH